VSRKPDNHAGLRAFLNTAIPQNGMYIGKTTPGAVVAGRVLAKACHVTTTIRGNKRTFGTDRTQDALGQLARATADLRARLRA